MKFNNLLIATLLLLSQSCSTAPQETSLAKGAQFIDRFLPLPKGEITSNCWGAHNVIPRNISNGLDEAEYSYWGGNIVKGDDEKYHIFAARWRENVSKPNGKSGHELWWSSEVAHAISDTPTGPYRVIDVVGSGHNPEIYRTKDGSYIIGVMGDKAYKAENINGPWTQITPTFDLIDGNVNRTNRTYITREDGSVYMMNKEGLIFISPNGDEHFIEQDLPRAYYRKNGSHEEDPVIWKDEVCYNLVVNSCLAREAFHLTSKDGKYWQYEDGLAYTPEEVAVNEDGTRERWWKLERPKVLCDEYGRPTHMNFAAIDTLKAQDVANDNHSSKNIVIPLRIARRLELTYLDKENIAVKLLAEEGFNPLNDVDFNTLHFGNTKLVNYGQGATVFGTKASGNSVILEFKRKQCGFAHDDYKAKLLGRLKNGEPIWGNVRIDVKY